MDVGRFSGTMAHRPVISDETNRELDEAVLEYFGVSPSRVEFDGKVQMLLNALETTSEGEELDVETPESAEGNGTVQI